LLPSPLLAFTAVVRYLRRFSGDRVGTPFLTPPAMTVQHSPLEN